jgi:TnpA family transposase
MDDVELRQIIHKQLNKGENANKFARAVSWGNSGEIKYASKSQ